MKFRLVALLAALTFSLAGAAAHAEALPLPVLPTAMELPPETVGQRVTVVGRLELAGRNYFRDPRFVIVDGQNRVVRVTTWAPLEIPPPMPEAPRSESLPPTMHDYLHRTLSVLGIHRMVLATAGGPTTLATNGQSYIQVEVVTDMATGRTLFSALDAASVGDDARATASEPDPSLSPTAQPHPKEIAPEGIGPDPAKEPAGERANEVTPAPGREGQKVAVELSPGEIAHRIEKENSSLKDQDGTSADSPPPPPSPPVSSQNPPDKGASS